METNLRKKTVAMAETALMAAVICVLAPHSITIPVSPVVVTLGLFAVYLAAAVLGEVYGTLSILLYLLIGLCGVPVFSGYSAGPAKLFGPTGGYLIGYLPCAFIIGFFVRRFKKIYVYPLAMAAGTVVLYLFGTVWFMFVYTKGTAFIDALEMCVFPFLPFDAAKIILAGAAAYPVRRALINAGLLAP